MRKEALLIFLLAATAGCATRPVPNALSAFVPSDRILDATYLRSAPGTGVVTLKRDAGLGGSACAARVYVNTRPIADLRTSEKIVLHLPPGDYIFSSQPNSICAGGLSEVRSNVAAGAELTFRIGYGSNGDFSINASAF